MLQVLLGCSRVLCSCTDYYSVPSKLAHYEPWVLARIIINTCFILRILAYHIEVFRAHSPRTAAPLDLKIPTLPQYHTESIIIKRGKMSGITMDPADGDLAQVRTQNVLPMAALECHSASYGTPCIS